MTFVSYAQNFEDVILWRALHDVQDGRYIDIGAQEPEFDSVSFAFYKAGWRGVHVEPTPAYAARLREARPNETVIEAAVTDAPGPIPFFELGGLSTGRPDIAEYHSQRGHQPRATVVPTVRLEQVLDLVETDIHWLKIDVEGMEADVLRSWGASKKRPWILVIESTQPNSQQTTQHLWIEEVLSRAYQEALFDGLSRYFIHESHSDLFERLNRPVNVFDDFQITSQHFSAVLMRKEAEAQEKASQARMAALSLDILQMRDRVLASETETSRERTARAEEAERLVKDIEDLRSRARAAERELAIEQTKRGQLEERERNFSQELATAQEQVRGARAEEIQRLVKDLEDLRSRARTAERELAIEQTKREQLEERQRNFSQELATAQEQVRTASQAKSHLNSELLKISWLFEDDAGRLTDFSGQDTWTPAGNVYAAVKSHVALAEEELSRAREFAVQQFVSGQQSRDSEIGFLHERVRSLQDELATFESQLREAKSRSAEEESERSRLQSLVEEQAIALDLLKSDAGQLERLLSDTREFLSSVYSSRRGRLAVRLNLLPTRYPVNLEIPRSRPTTETDRDKSERSEVKAQAIEMDVSVNQIRHTTSLLALNGTAFVDALYRTFLKRSPDRIGRDHFIARLRAGDQKEAVLLAIADSPEARSTGVKIEGLQELRRALSRPTGWNIFNRRARMLDVRLNRLEYNIGEAHNSLAERLERIESSIEQVQVKLSASGSGAQLADARGAGVYVQGAPVSIKRGISIRPTNKAAEFITELRDGLQSSIEALSLRNGR